MHNTYPPCGKLIYHLIFWGKIREKTGGYIFEKKLSPTNENLSPKNVDKLNIFLFFSD